MRGLYRQAIAVQGAVYRHRLPAGEVGRSEIVNTSTILIVDDEPQNRKLLETLLLPEGYITVSVDSGEAALAEVARCPPDLILLDVMMPGMDGYQVAKLLKDDHATSNI